MDLKRFLKNIFWELKLQFIGDMNIFINIDKGDLLEIVDQMPLKFFSNPLRLI